MKIRELKISYLLLIICFGFKCSNNYDRDIEAISKKSKIGIKILKEIQGIVKTKPEVLRSKHINYITGNQITSPNPSGYLNDTVGAKFSFEKKTNKYKFIEDIRLLIDTSNYKIFLCDSKNGMESQIAIIKSQDNFEPLRIMQTNGLNYNIDTKNLIEKLKDLGLGLKIIGADFDWCEFDITNEPKDWKILSKSIYKLCPDIVEQGTGTEEVLEIELRNTKKLYLWFD